ncbi:MAG: hypothetical protein R3B06_26260 [Kofleriaceae bacterium]
MATDARAQFAADGVVALAGHVDAGTVAAMRAAVWAALAARGVAEDDPRTWVAGGALPLVDVAGALRPGPAASAALWAIGRGPAFATVPGLLQSAVDQVFGPGVWAPVDDDPGGLVMPNFPAADRWAVPHQAWHVDEPTAPGQEVGWGLLAFLLLDEVVAGGGATVMVAGSPRRLGQLADDRAAVITTEVALAALRDDPAYAALVGDGAGPPVAGTRGVPRLVELTGAAGDLILMDPRALHCVSANAARRPRLALRLVCRRA